MVTPFTDTQAEIRKKIRDERVNDSRRNTWTSSARFPFGNIFEEAAGVAAVTP